MHNLLAIIKIRFGFALTKENFQWEFRPSNLY